MDPDNEISAASHRYDFVWQIGVQDLKYGLQRSRDLFLQDIQKTSNGQQALHIAVFVMMFFCLGVFSHYLFKPFLKRTMHETKRVAELLSQIPGGLDVEGLIETSSGKKVTKQRRAGPVDKQKGPYVPTAKSPKPEPRVPSRRISIVD